MLWVTQVDSYAYGPYKKWLASYKGIAGGILAISV